MKDFFEKISEVKQRTNEEIIQIKIDGRDIALKVIDNSVETVSLSTKWRAENLKWFQSNFVPDNEKTKKWIQDSILDNPGRILFMIYLNGKKIGQTGLDRYISEDSSIDITGTIKDRSVKDPKVMEYSRKALCKWVFDFLQLDKIFIRIYSDNYRNISLAERCGGLTVNSIPMKRIRENNEWKWIEVESDSKGKIAERYLNIMEITKERLHDC